ncbi:10522_t:CDS:2 [Entrophospora sp. SA101]|nr:10522_t:CDS:2 [Entrophospora sp. SA101]
MKLSTGRLINTFKGHEYHVCTLQNVENILVSGSADKKICIWDPSNALFYVVRSIMPQNINSSLLIVTGSEDSTLKIWCLPNLKTDKIHRLHHPTTLPPLPDKNQNLHILALSKITLAQSAP